MFAVVFEDPRTRCMLQMHLKDDKEDCCTRPSSSKAGMQEPMRACILGGEWQILTA